MVTKSIISVIDRKLEENNHFYDCDAIIDFFRELRHYFKHEFEASDGRARHDFYQLSKLANDALELLEFQIVNYRVFNLYLYKKTNNNQLLFSDFWEFYADFNKFIPIFEVSWGNISSGQKALLNVFSRFYSLVQKPLSKNLLVLIDEGDIYFHPQWQKSFVRDILKFLTNIFFEKNIQVILTSHSPFIISDLPPNNVILLGQKSDKEREQEKDKEIFNEGKPTFAANFHTLFADSFFIKEGLIGDYAKEKINEIIDSMKCEKIDSEFEKYAKKLINLIGEPVIREKLNQLFFDYLDKVKTVEDSINAEILDLEKQIKTLEEKREKIRLSKQKDESDDSNKQKY